MHKKLYILLTALQIITYTNAQNNVGIGTLAPDVSALLDLTTSEKGLLIPRLTAAQRTAISTPAISLLVYDTDAACFFYYKNSIEGWINLCSAVNVAIGSTGVNGLTGITGHTGHTGITGATGMVGATGVQGIIGTTGIQGVTGNNGNNGMIGVTGATGLNGTNGTTGTQGVTGSQGIVGTTGAQGTTGTAGVVGTTGNIGSTGEVGNTGYTGIAGNTGAIGITGNTGSGSTGFTGTMGATGFSGTVGNTGATGVTGNSGNVGFTGRTGFTGAVGVTGSTGAIGVMGNTGITGFTGTIGTTGYTGVAGIKGNTGTMGSTGFTGTAGITGFTGNIGVTGNSGTVGVTGNTGTVGSTGFTGTVGKTGFTGNVGATGNTGTVGASGNTGTIGSTGGTGTVGITGFTGNVGITGNSGTVGVTGNTGTVGSTGSTGTVGITGFTGYIGITGNTGTIGVTGDTGSIGNTGFTGAVGTTGFTGDVGMTGNTGTIGATGDTGNIGNTGFTGIVGATGFTGDVGGTGTVGSTGPTGIMGTTGFTGATGPVGCTGANFLLKSTGTSATCTVAPVFEDNSGKVGIATLNPNNTLQVGDNIAGNNTDYSISVRRHGDLAAPGIYSAGVPALTIQDISGDGPGSAETGGLLYVAAPRIADADANAGNANLVAVSNDNGSALVVKANRKTGIATASPAQTFSVAGTIGVSEAGNTGNRLLISSSGSGAEIFQNDNSGIIFKTLTGTQEKMLIADNGRVGIGTVSVGGPTALLDVNGSARIRSLTAGFVKSDASGNLSSGAIAAADLPSGSGYYIQNQTSQQSSANFNIDGNGTIANYLGVGTTASATARLTVYGGTLGSTVGDVLELARFNSSNPHGASLRIYNYRHTTAGDWTTANTKIQQRIDATDQAYIEFNPQGGSYGLAFGNGSSEYVRFLNGGNVGIGNTAPSYKLDVTGNARIGATGSLLIASLSASRVNLRPSVGNGDIIITDDSGNPARGLTVANGGNVGIKTDNPSSTLTVGYGEATPAFRMGNSGYTSNYNSVWGMQSGAQSIMIFGNNGQNEIRAGNTNAGGYLDFFTNNTADYTAASNGTFTMRLASNGNVGIGVNPSYKLHVNGTIAGDGGSNVDPYIMRVHAQGLLQHHDGNSGYNPTTWHQVVLGDNGTWGGNYSRLYLRRGDGTYTNEIRVSYADGTPSDRKLKKNISPILESELRPLAEKLLNTQLYHYQFKNDPNGDSTLRYIGFMADEIPAEIQMPKQGGVKIGDTFAMMLAAIKMLKQENEELLKRIEQLEKR